MSSKKSVYMRNQYYYFHLPRIIVARAVQRKVAFALVIKNPCFYLH